MSNHKYENSICLDPSCFTSLNLLKDTVKVVEAYKENKKLFIPTDIFNTLNLQPDEKFARLPDVLGGWMENIRSNINNIKGTEKEQYVELVRYLFMYYDLSSLDEVIKEERIGDESIHLADLIIKFGSITGKILFQMMAASSKLKIKIIAFGRKTVSLIRQNGSAVLEFSSKKKKEIKRKTKINTSLVIIMFFIGTNAISEIFKELPRIGFLTIPEIAILGILLVGNG